MSKQRVYVVEQKTQARDWHPIEWAPTLLGAKSLLASWDGAVGRLGRSYRIRRYVPEGRALLVMRGGK